MMKNQAIKLSLMLGAIGTLTACFDGNYPIPVEDGMRKSKLMLEPAGVAAGLQS